LPASGLAVYHCDILGSNEFQSGTAQKHYQCALLQADGHRDLETNENQGDGTDLFASVAGVVASSTTNPSTRLWSGADSGLLLSDVGVPDDKISFRVGSAPSGLVVHAESTGPIPIPDNEPTGVTSTITVDRVGVIKSLTVKVDVTHTYIGDLSIDLLSPTGERVTLHSRTGAGTDNLSAAYESSTFAGLQPLVGQAVQGKWALRVRDLEGADTGKLVRWSIDAVIEGAPSVITLDAKPNLAIPDNDATGVSSTINVDRAGTVGTLKVSIDIKHTWIGDLRIQLVSPAGRVAVLHGQLGGDTDDLVVTYDSSAPLSPLSGLIGQGVRGTWTLRVADLAAQDIGKLNRWALEITAQ
jgi:subtilisin-like proprotein convertase family protein